MSLLLLETNCFLKGGSTLVNIQSHGLAFNVLRMRANRMTSVVECSTIMGVSYDTLTLAICIKRRSSAIGVRCPLYIQCFFQRHVQDLHRLESRYRVPL